MKKLFFTIFLCVVMAGTANAAAISLDTVRTTYDDGRVYRIYTVQKGTEVREGVSLTYHPNGKLAVEAPYKNGKLEGVLRSYYENGKLLETIGYKNGIEEGYSTSYHENGKRKSREFYRQGELNGVSEEWDQKGNLRRQIPYENGQIHGVAKFFNELGVISEDMNFVRGIRNGAYHRYSFGKVEFEALFLDNRCVRNCNF